MLCFIKRRRYRCRDSQPRRGDTIESTGGDDTLEYFLYIFHNKSASSQPQPHTFKTYLQYVFLLCHSPKRHLPISNYIQLLLLVAAFWVRFNIHWLFFLGLKNIKTQRSLYNKIFSKNIALTSLSNENKFMHLLKFKNQRTLIIYIKSAFLRVLSWSMYYYLIIRYPSSYLFQCYLLALVRVVEASSCSEWSRKKRGESIYK